MNEQVKRIETVIRHKGFAGELSHQLILRYYEECAEIDAFLDRVWQERNILQARNNIRRAESWRIRLWCILNLDSPRKSSE